MRTFVLLALLLTACDDFSTAQQQDTIQSYEDWLQRNGEQGSQAVTALTRLEQLYQAKAEKEATLEAYDAYLQRFPKGKNRPALAKAREDLLFEEAERAGSVEGWKRFSSLCPDAGRRLEMAKAGALAAEYAPKLTIAPVTTQPVNLAEDPKGPMNGTGFSAEIVNSGDRTLSLLWFNLLLLDASDKVIGRLDGPLVAPQAASRYPIAPENRVPLKPGEKRTWKQTAEVLPEGFAGKVRLVPARAGFAEGG